MAKISVLRDGSVVEQEIVTLGAGAREEKLQEIAQRRAARTSISATAFLARFTDQEYSAIITAANAELAQGGAQLYRWIETVRASGVVYPAGEQAGLARAALVGAELLTEERAEVIFAA